MICDCCKLEAAVARANAALITRAVWKLREAQPEAVVRAIAEVVYHHEAWRSRYHDSPSADERRERSRAEAHRVVRMAVGEKWPDDLWWRANELKRGIYRSRARADLTAGREP